MKATEDLQKWRAALLNLQQPWNPAVSAILHFLHSQSARSVCWVQEIVAPFAETLHKNGAWCHRDIPVRHSRDALGIVLSGRVDVVADQEGDDLAAGMLLVRPKPIHVLTPGALVGTFEHSDHLLDLGHNYGYKLMAGPVCIQFDYPGLQPLLLTKTAEKALLQKVDARSDRHLKAYSLWRESGCNYYLVQAMTGEVEKMEAVKILMIGLPEYFEESIEISRLREVVINSAWTQSSAARRSAFGRTNGRFLLRPNPTYFPPEHVNATQGLLDQLDRAIDGDAVLWAPVHPNSVEASFLKPMIERLREVRLGSSAFKERPISMEDIYLACPLSDAHGFGLVSIVDGVIRVKNGKDPLASGQTGQKLHGARRGEKDSPLIRIHHDIEDAITRYKPLPFSAPELRLRSWRPGFNGAAIPSEIDISKANPFSRIQLQVSSMFPVLPILEKLDAELHLDYSVLDNVLIFGCQHFLRETGCWMQHVLSRSPTTRVMLVGKDYSTSPVVSSGLRKLGVAVVEEGQWKWGIGCYEEFLKLKIANAWRDALTLAKSDSSINKIVVVDDGGFVINTIPFEELHELGISVTAIEQTTSGVVKNPHPPLPVVSIAQSPAKRRWESGMIVDAIYDRLQRCHLGIDPQKTGVAILGAKGSIGGALMDKLTKESFRRVKGVEYGDDQPKIDEALGSSELIFGCTGRDVLERRYCEKIVDKCLVSCSSTDIEFHSILRSEAPPAKLLRETNPFSTVLVNLLPGAPPVRVLNGGFPINFDRSPDSVPLGRIQLTRGLMHVGLFQAMHAMRSDSLFSGLVALDVEMDKLVLKLWRGA